MATETQPPASGAPPVRPPASTKPGAGAPGPGKKAPVACPPVGDTCAYYPRHLDPSNTPRLAIVTELGAVEGTVNLSFFHFPTDVAVQGWPPVDIATDVPWCPDLSKIAESDHYAGPDDALAKARRNQASAHPDPREAKIREHQARRAAAEGSGDGEGEQDV